MIAAAATDLAGATHSTPSPTRHELRSRFRLVRLVGGSRGETRAGGAKACAKLIPVKSRPASRADFRRRRPLEPSEKTVAVAEENRHKEDTFPCAVSWHLFSASSARCQAPGGALAPAYGSPSSAEIYETGGSGDGDVWLAAATGVTGAAHSTMWSSGGH